MHSHAPSWIIFSTKATADVGNQALIPAVVFTALALIALIMRWYTRVFMIRRVDLGDVLLAASMILSMAMTGVIGAETQLDAEIQNNEIEAHLLTIMMKLVFAQGIFFHTCINLVKVSIIHQYMHIFSLIRAFNKICYILLVVVTGATAWGIIGVIFMCKPVQKYWDPGTPGSCLDVELHFWSSAIIGIVLDFTLWLLPMPVIGTLNLVGRQKIGLVFVFGLGGFVCIVSVLRLCLVHNAAEAGEVTKSGTYVVVWSTIEVNVAIICASLLVMKPLILRIFPSLESNPLPLAREDAGAIRSVNLSSSLDAREEQDRRGSEERKEKMKKMDMRNDSAGGEAMLEVPRM